MPRKTRWDADAIARLRVLAENGAAVSEIMTAMDAPKNSVIAAAFSYGIVVTKHTAAELAEMQARVRDRDRSKKQVLRHRDIDARHRAAGLPAVSRTSPAYRNQLPTIGNLTKTQLRAMLAEAARNTAEMSV
jgi:hypothetical protein